MREYFGKLDYSKLICLGTTRYYIDYNGAFIKYTVYKGDDVMYFAEDAESGFFVNWKTISRSLLPILEDFASYQESGDF